MPRCQAGAEPSMAITLFHVQCSIFHWKYGYVLPNFIDILSNADNTQYCRLLLCNHKRHVKRCFVSSEAYLLDNVLEFFQILSIYNQKQTTPQNVLCISAIINRMLNVKTRRALSDPMIALFLSTSPPDGVKRPLRSAFSQSINYAKQ